MAPKKRAMSTIDIRKEMKQRAKSRASIETNNNDESDDETESEAEQTESEDPVVIKFKTQDFKLLSIYHSLGYILFVSGSPDPEFPATMENFYAPYFVLYTQWCRVISRAKFSPFVSCAAVFKDSAMGSLIEYLYVMCSFTPMAYLSKLDIKKVQATALDDVGFLSVKEQMCEKSSKGGMPEIVEISSGRDFISFGKTK